MVSFALVGYQSPMWLHHNRIKVFHTVVLKRRKDSKIKKRILNLVFGCFNRELRSSKDRKYVIMVNWSLRR